MTQIMLIWRNDGVCKYFLFISCIWMSWICFAIWYIVAQLLLLLTMKLFIWTTIFALMSSRTLPCIPKFTQVLKAIYSINIESVDNMNYYQSTVILFQLQAHTLCSAEIGGDWKRWGTLGWQCAVHPTKFYK